MPYKDRAEQREYQKIWARRNKKGKEELAAYKAKQRKKLRGIVLEYLDTHPCVVCGELDPIVLEFDHLDPSTKYGSIADLVGRTHGEATIRREIEKCQVLCANCHRRKTAKQLGYYKNNAR